MWENHFLTVNSTGKFSFMEYKKKKTALAGVAQWIECQPANQRGFLKKDLKIKKKKITTQTNKVLISHFLEDFIYLFLERGEGKEKERERNIDQCVVLTHVPPTRDLPHDPGVCTDWESNQRPFGSQASTQSIEPHPPRLNLPFWMGKFQSESR